MFLWSGSQVYILFRSYCDVAGVCDGVVCSGDRVFCDRVEFASVEHIVGFPAFR